jgi:NADPH:quinone reductase-like Zn-dependent oxidoreductase
VPEIGEDQVLVRVHAAGVNPLDRHLVRATPWPVKFAAGFRRPKVSVPGADFAGTVEAVGANVQTFKAGDRVYGEARRTFAEYAAVNERVVAPMPVGLGFTEAASLPVVALTAIQGLRDTGKVGSGDRVLVNGASGGVGSMAVQIAKALGAEVTGVCRTANMEMVRALGADHVVDYTKHDYTAGSAKYDVILDTAGNHPLRRSLRVLASEGRLVMVGSAELKYIGPLVRAAIVSIFVKQKLGTFTARSSRDDLLFLNGLIESGKVRPVIDRTFDLSDAASAIAFVEQGHTRGKVVISVG